jgi:glycerate-2-kinase
MSITISNKEQLTTTPLRRQALAIMEAGLAAIDTGKVIAEAVRIEGDQLIIKNQTFSLTNFKRLFLVGFGKASCDAAVALEKILGQHIKSGIVIDIKAVTCETVTVVAGSHPKPTLANVEASNQVVELAKTLTAEDLVIVVVSGGGSALLCWPQSEYEAGLHLYEAFLEAGGTIAELNLVRKHLSGLKGGGLAAVLQPATVVGLIFSDVPGGELSDIASGPTYYDDSTIEDARQMLLKYNIDAGAYALVETPKDKSIFERIYNIPLVTNDLALTAMASEAEQLGFKPIIVSPRMYDFSAPTLDQFQQATEVGPTVALGGGEIRLIVTSKGGSGGRNLYLANEALLRIKNEGELFIAMASDGIDNCPVAGGLVDIKTVRKADELGLDTALYLARYDGLTLFEQLGDTIITGQTGANVADLMMYIKE